MAAIAATLTIFTFLAFRSETGSVSATTPPSKRETFEQLNREAFEKNITLREQYNPQSLDPSITDDIALGLLLRFISGNQNEQQKTQLRRYMSDVLGVKNGPDQDKLFEVGERYRLQSNQIQMQSEAITLKYHPSHSMISSADRLSLRQLAERKTTLVRNSKRDLRQDLSSGAWASIESALDARVKPRIKVSYHQ